MPSFPHEAPLELLRECPELAVRVLRELLGFEVPAGRPIAAIEADFTQPRPTERRAELVLRVGGDDPVLGIIVEVQRSIDARKGTRGRCTRPRCSRDCDVKSAW